MNSKEYSWKFISADELLSRGPCELLYAYAIVSGTSVNTHIYNGNNVNGDKVTTLGITVVSNSPINSVIPPAVFRPLVPIYCEKGLYVDVGSNVIGVFVQWREVPRVPG